MLGLGIFLKTSGKKGPQLDGGEVFIMEDEALLLDDDGAFLTDI